MRLCTCAAANNHTGIWLYAHRFNTVFGMAVRLDDGNRARESKTEFMQLSDKIAPMKPTHSSLKKEFTWVCGLANQFFEEIRSLFSHTTHQPLKYIHEQETDASNGFTQLPCEP